METCPNRVNLKTQNALRPKVDTITQNGGFGSIMFPHAMKKNEILKMLVFSKKNLTKLFLYFNFRSSNYKVSPFCIILVIENSTN